MATGTVKWFNNTKGFKTLIEGQTVTFDIESGPKGLTAVNVYPK
jgi:CspA family cold shock protein